MADAVSSYGNEVLVGDILHIPLVKFAWGFYLAHNKPKSKPLIVIVVEND